MKKSLILAGALAALALGSPVAADDDDCYVAMSEWQSRAAVRDMAEAQGWQVRRIKIDDGCYEIKGRDANGHEIEVKIDPATLEVIEFEYEDDDDHDDDDDDYGRRMPPRTQTQSAPDNGLFVPGTSPTVVVR